MSRSDIRTAESSFVAGASARKMEREHLEGELARLNSMLATIGTTSRLSAMYGRQRDDVRAKLAHLSNGGL